MSDWTVRRATVDDIARIVELRIEFRIATDDGHPLYERAGFHHDDRYMR